MSQAERADRPSMRDPLSLLTEEVVNRALALDPEADRILAGLDGARLRVKVDGVVPACVLLELHGARVKVSTDRDGPADAEVAGSAERLLAMLRAGDGLPSVYGVQVSGDVAKLAAFVRAAREISPDWEEPIARVLGDSAARPVISGLRALARFAERSVAELTDSAAEFLREESELLIRPEHVNEMTADVRRISEETARIEKRILAIERRLDRRA